MTLDTSLDRVTFYQDASRGRGDGVLRITSRLRHFAMAGAVALSACAAPQLSDNNVGPAEGSATGGGNAGDRLARPQSRSVFGLIAPATDRSGAKPEFISRGTGEFVGKSDAVVAAKTLKGTDGVTINLLNAPIAQAAKTVLGDILKADYVI